MVGCACRENCEWLARADTACAPSTAVGILHVVPTLLAPERHDPLEHRERNAETATENLPERRRRIPDLSVVDELPPSAFPRIHPPLLHWQRCLPQQLVTRATFFFFLLRMIIAFCITTTARAASLMSFVMFPEGDRCWKNQALFPAPALLWVLDPASDRVSSTTRRGSLVLETGFLFPDRVSRMHKDRP